jgi:hypothetical protein
MLGRHMHILYLCNGDCIMQTVKKVTLKKGKAVPLHAMQVYLLFILDLGTRWGECSASRPGKNIQSVLSILDAPGKLQ